MVSLWELSLNPPNSSSRGRNMCEKKLALNQGGARDGANTKIWCRRQVFYLHNQFIPSFLIDIPAQVPLSTFEIVRQPCIIHTLYF